MKNIMVAKSSSIYYLNFLLLLGFNVFILESFTIFISKMKEMDSTKYYCIWQ